MVPHAGVFRKAKSTRKDIGRIVRWAAQLMVIMCGLYAYEPIYYGTQSGNNIQTNLIAKL